MVLQYLNALG